MIPPAFPFVKHFFSRGMDIPAGGDLDALCQVALLLREREKHGILRPKQRRKVQQSERRREKGAGAIMEQDRVRLVPADTGLAEALAAYYRRNEEFLRPFEPAREAAFFTPEYQRTVLEQEVRNRAEKTAYRFYLVPAEEPGKIIGVIGLNNVVWGAFRSAFLGCKLDKDYVNQGYMTTAVEMVTRYAFEELRLHRIEGNVMPRNTASLRVLEKNHFEEEGLARRYLKINGVWEDHIHMVKLNDALSEED